MEKIIQIDGQDVKFKATAATLRLYRERFNRDLIIDIDNVIQALRDGENQNIDLALYENIAYTLAKQADENIPDDIIEWLDNFSVLAIKKIFPEVLELWIKNMSTLVEPKKKGVRTAEK